MNLGRLVPYLDLEHTLDAWYWYTSLTNSGRPGTMLLTTIDYSQGMRHRHHRHCPVASVLSGRRMWLLYAFCVSFSYFKAWGDWTDGWPDRTSDAHRLERPTSCSIGHGVAVPSVYSKSYNNHQHSFSEVCLFGSRPMLDRAGGGQESEVVREGEPESARSGRYRRWHCYWH